MGALMARRKGKDGIDAAFDELIKGNLPLLIWTDFAMDRGLEWDELYNAMREIAKKRLKKHEVSSIKRSLPRSLRLYINRSIRIFPVYNYNIDYMMRYFRMDNLIHQERYNVCVAFRTTARLYCGRLADLKIHMRKIQAENSQVKVD
jgi:hypothetical protein